MLRVCGAPLRHNVSNLGNGGRSRRRKAQRYTGTGKCRPPKARRKSTPFALQRSSVTSRLTSVLIVSKLSFKLPGFGRIAMIPVAFISCRERRIASRNFLFIRTRSVALPSRFETSTHQAKRASGLQIRVKQFPVNRWPSLSKPAISTRLFRLRDRGKLFFPGN